MMGFPVCPKCLDLIFWDLKLQQWRCDECGVIKNPAIYDEDIVVAPATTKPSEAEVTKNDEK